METDQNGQKFQGTLSWSKREKNLERKRKRNLLDKLAGCEVYFLADYLNNLFDFGQICPEKREIDFVRYNLSLKKIELKEERRRPTDFSLSHKGNMFPLPVLKQKLFALLHWCFLAWICTVLVNHNLNKVFRGSVRV